MKMKRKVGFALCTVMLTASIAVPTVSVAASPHSERGICLQEREAQSQVQVRNPQTSPEREQLNRELMAMQEAGLLQHSTVNAISGFEIPEGAVRLTLTSEFDDSDFAAFFEPGTGRISIFAIDGTETTPMFAEMQRRAAASVTPHQERIANLQEREPQFVQVDIGLRSERIRISEELMQQTSGTEPIQPLQPTGGERIDIANGAVRVLLTSTVDDSLFVALLEAEANRISIFTIDGVAIQIFHVEDGERFTELVNLRQDNAGR